MTINSYSGARGSLRCALLPNTLRANGGAPHVRQDRSARGSLARYLRWLGALGLCAALTTGCGAAGASATETADGRSDAQWTQAQLRKLDPELRTQVQRGGDARIAVKVYFHELPTDSELADMLLNRLGEQAIGEIEPQTLQRIAARSDVERIERLRDVGYDLE